MLLQGPVGPFFAELHEALVAQGSFVDRVIFNAGDRLFASQNSCLRFSGDLGEWETWLRFQIARNTPDAFVLFGSNRPAHEVARRIAGLFGIAVISLEEGYLRSGYIACEIGGNNQNSALADWQWQRENRGAGPARRALPPSGASSFATMGLWGALYYLARDMFCVQSDEHLFHRQKEQPLVMACSWFAHTARRAFSRLLELPKLRRLRAIPGYILVPLQLPTDSQILFASRGWNSWRLIDSCLHALVRSGTGQRLIFKLHPLDREGATVRRMILQRARQLGLSRNRVQVLSTGRIGDLARNSGGMVVINSTSAFSAMHHDVPVLVLGQAVYRHESVVTTGETEADVETFFKLRHARRQDTINAFLDDLKAQSLLPGDFYAARGRKIAISGIIAKLGQIQATTRVQRRVFQ